MKRSLLFTAVLALLALPSPAQILFERATEDWGLAFRHHHGGTGKFYMVETMGSGVVIFDYDQDGDPDVFFVNGGATPGFEGDPGRSTLYRNEAPGTFVDVTDAAGIVVTGYGMGATAGDVDGDGDPDLFVSSFGANQLFLNNGDGTFTDNTTAAGVGDPQWGTSTAFADPDSDGDLDLYVVNYVDFSYENNKPCGPPNMRSYCHPDSYNGQHDLYYRNRGDGTFEEMAAEIFGDTAGKGLGLVWSDLDGDLDQDLYVANDMTFNFHFQNLGGGAFEEIALLTGTAVGDHGQEEASMGVALGDVDGDGRPEIFVTHLDRETNALYSNAGGEQFNDRRFQSGLAEASLFQVGFGTVFTDLDSDGDQDLAVANGHVTHNIELRIQGPTYKQRNQVFENVGQGRYREVTASGFDTVLVSRGLAIADLDLDGDQDVTISNCDDVAEVYRNVSSQGGWLRLELASATGNRQAIGARAEVVAGEKRQWQEVRTGSSYLSQSELPLHFGMGAADVDEVVIRWPNGQQRRILRPPLQRQLRITNP